MLFVMFVEITHLDPRLKKSHPVEQKLQLSVDIDVLLLLTAPE